MQPILLPLIEHGVRNALKRTGFTTRMISTALGRVHAYEAPGSGTLPTMVLLHGLSSAATPFAPILSRLRKRARRVVALDYPGHGFSEPPAATLTPQRLFDV